MLYKFLAILLIFSTSFVFATDPNNLGEKRERPEDEGILNNELPAKKMAIFLLHKACEEGDIEKVKELLMTEDVNQKDGNGNTPILAACAHGQAEVVELFLGKDYVKYININESNKQGYTLLQLACEKLKDEKAQQIIEKITAHRHICINYRNKQNNTALMIACINSNLAAIKALLKHPNIDVNFADEKSLAPLHLACINNMTEIVKELLNHPNTDVNAKCDRDMFKEWDAEELRVSHIDKLSPLHLACEFGNKKIVKLLLKNNKTNINEITKTFGHTALSIAVDNHRSSIVKLLLKEKVTDIYETGEYNDSEVPLKILIRIIKDNKEVNDNSELIIKAFIKYKWEQIDNEDKKELLKKCIEYQKTHLVSLILEKDDKKQKEIKDFLLNSDSSKDEQIQNLLKSVSELNDEMQGPSSGSENNFNIEDDFNINVEELFLSACSNNDKDTLQMLIERYVINNSDLYSKGLIRVSDSKSTDIIELAKFLISHNADVNYLDDKNMSPLHHACDRANLELVKLLISHNAVVNYLDHKKMSPLHYACERVNLELVKLLLDNHADVNSKDENYLTPLDIILHDYRFSSSVSKKENLKNFIKLLLEKNTDYLGYFDEDNATKALLEEIKKEILVETKSMW